MTHCVHVLLLAGQTRRTGACLSLPREGSNRSLSLPALQAAAPGAALNLERALAADGRNSGHLVQGHVDDVGTIEAMVPDGEALTVRDAERDP